MKKKNVAILAVLLTFSMACVITDMFSSEPVDEQGDLAATLSVLQTQLAVTPEDAEPTLSPIEASTATPEPTPAPDFEYEYLSFNYHPSLASNVWGETIPEDVPEEDVFPVQAPQHILAHFDNYIIGDHFHTPEVRAYPIERYREISDIAVGNIDYLIELLGTQSTTENYYPYLPFVPAGQIILAQVKYISFDGGQGVRYLTQMGQALFPANNHSIFYSFQGISDNGYYISVTLPVHHPELLNNGEDVGNDWDPYYDVNAWDIYKAETEEQINGYADDSFAPSLVLLDDLVRSIKVTP